MSGLILLVIVGAWLAVLVPMALRSHDAGRSLSTVDKFHDAMRVLSRREGDLPVPPPRTPSPGTPAPRPRAAAAPAARSGLSVAARRRRVLLGLAVTALAGLVGGLVGPRWLLGVHLLADLLGVAYVGHLRHQTVLRHEREWRAALGERVPGARPHPDDAPAEVLGGLASDLARGALAPGDRATGDPAVAARERSRPAARVLSRPSSRTVGTRAGTSLGALDTASDAVSGTARVTAPGTARVTATAGRPAARAAAAATVRYAVPGRVAGIPDRLPSRELVTGAAPAVPVPGAPFAPPPSALTPSALTPSALTASALTASAPAPPAPVRGAVGEPWEPVPVPLPGYVTAPTAPRRVLDLTRPGEWSDGVAAAEQALGIDDQGPDLEQILERRRAAGDW